jgi:hypothetical protein
MVEKDIWMRDSTSINDGLRVDSIDYSHISVCQTTLSNIVANA